MVLQTNLELARRAYSLWNAGGVDAWLEHVFAPDIVFHDLEQGPDTSIFHGVDEVVAGIRAIVAAFGDVRFGVRSLEERAPYVMATLELSVKGASSGIALGVPIHHVSLWADGHMRELRAYLDADRARQEYDRLSSHTARDTERAVGRGRSPQAGRSNVLAAARLAASRTAVALSAPSRSMAGEVRMPAVLRKDDSSPFL